MKKKKQQIDLRTTLMPSTIKLENVGICDYPKIKAIVFVSRYMIKKHGEVEALTRTLKRKNPKIIGSFK